MQRSSTSRSRSSIPTSKARSSTACSRRTTKASLGPSNPDGYTRGYPALVAAIGKVGFPTIEVHISNPARRGAVSEVATSCLGTVTGFGIAGYALALRGLKDRAKAQA